MREWAREHKQICMHSLHLCCLSLCPSNYLAIHQSIHPAVHVNTLNSYSSLTLQCQFKTFIYSDFETFSNRLSFIAYNIIIFSMLKHTWNHFRIVSLYSCEEQNWVLDLFTILLFPAHSTFLQILFSKSYLSLFIPTPFVPVSICL